MYVQDVCCLYLAVAFCGGMACLGSGVFGCSRLSFYSAIRIFHNYGGGWRDLGFVTGVVISCSLPLDS